MSFHRPVAPERTSSPRLVGELGRRAPPHGRMRWQTRIGLIVIVSALLWTAIIFLLGKLF